MWVSRLAKPPWEIGITVYTATITFKPKPYIVTARRTWGLDAWRLLLRRAQPFPARARLCNPYPRASEVTCACASVHNAYNAVSGRTASQMSTVLLSVFNESISKTVNLLPITLGSVMLNVLFQHYYGSLMIVTQHQHPN